MLPTVRGAGIRKDVDTLLVTSVRREGSPDAWCGHISEGGLCPSFQNARWACEVESKSVRDIMGNERGLSTSKIDSCTGPKVRSGRVVVLRSSAFPIRQT